MSRWAEPRLVRISQAMMQTLRTDVLEIAYLDDGPRDGAPLLILHGWPDSPVGFERMSSRLHAAGYRTIAPFHRGFGATRFLSADTPRVGGAAALAQDALDFVDRLGIGRFSVIGHDWGARTGYALAALVPDRVLSLCALALAFQPRFEFRLPSYEQCRRFWYQFVMCGEQGAKRVTEDPIGFSRFQWETWSPPQWFAEDEFRDAAEAWENPDYAAITLNNYRSRWLAGEAWDLRYNGVQLKLGESGRIGVPTLMIQGGSDFCDPPSESEDQERYFSAGYKRVLLNGVGHFPHREAPDVVAEAVLSRLTTRNG